LEALVCAIRFSERPTISAAARLPRQPFMAGYISATEQRFREGTMSEDKAVVRQHLERIAGVTRTWFELSHVGGALLKTLVVEISFDTDPNAASYNQAAIDSIFDTAKGVLTDETTMTVSDLRIVPRDAR
jgi:hypothetical protein